ncbi:MAG: sugar ABC transporter permease [Chloroflexi bacterium]|nr:sugar ABC transporter permease [Chloroflexota bacterium]
MATQTARLGQTTAPSRSTSRRWRRLREVSLGYLLLAPALVLLIVFELFPVLYGFFISTCNWRLNCGENLERFIGFDNYVRAFTDPEMWTSLWTTAVYSLMSVPIQLGLGLLIAYLLFQDIRGKDVFRVMFFFPYITSTVASAAVWAYLYSPDRGLINAVARSLNLPILKWLGESKGIFELMAQGLGGTLPNALDGPPLALVALIIYTTWVFLGYDIAIFLAGLGNIPGELYDAAKVDGAAGWRLFRHITLPLLSPTTFFLLLLTVIGTFKAFNHIYVMTRGGPAGATETSSLYIFSQMFEYQRYGYSAALSFILFTVILIITIIQNRAAGSRVVYD